MQTDDRFEVSLVEISYEVTSKLQKQTMSFVLCKTAWFILSAKAIEFELKKKKKIYSFFSVVSQIT